MHCLCWSDGSSLTTHPAFIWQSSNMFYLSTNTCLIFLINTCLILPYNIIPAFKHMTGLCPNFYMGVWFTQHLRCIFHKNIHPFVPIVSYLFDKFHFTPTTSFCATLQWCCTSFKQGGGGRRRQCHFPPQGYGTSLPLTGEEQNYGTTIVCSGSNSGQFCSFFPFCGRPLRALKLSWESPAQQGDPSEFLS